MRLTEYHLAATPSSLPLTLALLTILGGIPVAVLGLRKNDRTTLVLGCTAALFGLTFLVYYGLRIAPMRQAILHNRLQRTSFGLRDNRVHPVTQRLRVVPHSLIPAQVIREPTFLEDEDEPLRTRSCPAGSIHMSRELSITPDDTRMPQTASAILGPVRSPLLMSRWENPALVLIPDFDDNVSHDVGGGARPCGDPLESLPRISI